MRVKRFSAASLLGTALATGSGGIALFDLVMGELIKERDARIETLEDALKDVRELAERCDARLERCHEIGRDCRHG